MADIPASTSTTATVAVNGSYQDTIETAYDFDWIKVTTVAGAVYTVLLQGQGTGDRTLFDPVIDGIFGSTGTYLTGFNNDGLIGGGNSRDAMTTFTATGTTHYIGVTGDMGVTGTYKLSVFNSSGGTDSVGQSISSFGSVTVGGGAVSGTIDSANDADWYKVTLAAGGIYSIRMRGLPSANGSLADPLISGVYDSGGNFIANTYVDDLDTRDAGVTIQASYGGDYYIAAEGFSNYTGSFVLDVTQLGSEIPGSIASGATLAVGASATVAVDRPYDHDWYKVTLTAGTTYTFALTGTSPNTTPGIYGIYNASGTYLEGYAVGVSSGATTTASTIFTPSVGGDYFVDAFSYYEGSYTLSVNAATADVPANTTSTTTVTVGAAALTGDIGSVTDVDWYKVTLTGGTTYTIRMQGSWSQNGTLFDPLISGIYSAGGSFIANTYADDKDGRDAVVTFRAPGTGSNVFFIAAEGYGANIGSYKISVTQVAAADIGDTVATAGALSLNIASAGLSIDDPSDTDWYGVTLAAGTTYYVKMQGSATGGGTLSDPLITGLYNSAGTWIANTMNDDNGKNYDAAVVYTASLGGTHYVGAEGYDAVTGTYTLSVLNEAGANAAGAWQIPYNAAAGGTIDNATDVDWYMYALEGGRSYVFKMYGLDSGFGSLSAPSINRILNASSVDQTASAAKGSIGATSTLRYAPGTAGDYYLELQRVGAVTGTFLVTAEIEAGNTNALSLPLGSNVLRASIDDASDADWYSVTLNANTSYVVKMTGADNGGGTLADPAVGLRNASMDVQAIVNDTTGYGRDAEFRYVVTTAGTYYIVADPVATATGTYTLSIDAEGGETNATAQAISVGDTINAAIDDNTDADWYSVALSANTSYVIKMLGVDSGGGRTLTDPAAGLRDSAAYVQAIVNDTAGYGRDAVFTYAVGATGATYYVVADPATAIAGSYMLSVNVEAGSTSATAVGVAVGSTTSGAIDTAADVDRYAVTLVGGRTYRIDAMGLDSGKGTLVDTYINGIRNNLGNLETGTTQDGGGSGRDAGLAFTPGASGVYYIDVDNGVANSAAVGSYMFSVVQTNPAPAPQLMTALVGVTDPSGHAPYF